MALWTGQILEWLSGHCEGNASAQWRAWNSFSAGEKTEFAIKAAAHVHEAIARQMPVHWQVTQEFVAFTVSLGVRAEFGGKTCLQFAADSGYIYFDGRSHPGEAHNAVDATYALADAITGAPHTGINGGVTDPSDWAGSVAGLVDVRTEHYTILVQGGTAGHPLDETHIAGIQVGTEAGGAADQTVVWSGNAIEVDAQIAVCNAVAAGTLETGIMRLHFNIGKRIDGTRSFFQTTTGETVFEQVDQVSAGVLPAVAARIEVLPLAEIVERWANDGPNATYMYDSDAVTATGRAIGSTGNAILFSSTSPWAFVPNLLGVIAGDLSGRADGGTRDWTAAAQECGITGFRNNDPWQVDGRLDVETYFDCNPTGLAASAFPDHSFLVGGGVATDATNFNNSPNTAANQQWGLADQAHTSIVTNGRMDWMVRLGGSSSHSGARGGHDQKGPTPATNEENRVAQAELNLLNRYLPTDPTTNWAGEPCGEYINAHTEFPETSFYLGTNAQFNNYQAQKQYPLIQAAFPTKKVGGPGFHPSVHTGVIAGTHGTNAAYLWVKRFWDYHVSNGGLAPGFVDIHLFSNDPDEIPTVVAAYRALLDGTGPYSDVGWAGTEFFAPTEILLGSWMMSFPSDAGVPLSEAEIHANNETTVGAAQGVAKLIRMVGTELRRAFLYRLEDLPSLPYNDPADPTIFQSGASPSGRSLYRPPRTGFPATAPLYQEDWKCGAWAFWLWKALYFDYRTIVGIAYPEDLGVGGLYAIRTRNAATGEQAAILVNRNTSPVPIRMDIPELVAASAVSVDTLTNYGVDTTTYTSGPFELPASTVVRLILTPASSTPVVAVQSSGHGYGISVAEQPFGGGPTGGGSLVGVG